MDGLAPGDRIDRYTIEASLGEGGMGRVYRAHDERLDRRVAVKVLLAEREEGSDGRARLLREARAAATLDHPNIVGVYDVGECDGAPFIVMELVEGRSLREVAADPDVPLLDRLRCLRDIAGALAAAHDAGLVHRDVKPENVVVRADGRVKVLDFGIARRKRPKLDPTQATNVSLSTLTADGIKVGTPMYMAPEQIRGQAVDGRTDQFGWGVTAYEVLTGKSPWPGKDSLEVMAAVLTETPPDLPGTIPAKARALILKALSKKPEDRCASMLSIVRTLDALIDPPVAPVSAAPSPPKEVAPPEPLSTPAASAPKPTSAAPPRPASMPAWGPPPGLETAAVPRHTLSRRYSPRELEEVLDRALRIQPDGDYRYDEVLGAAREVGIDEPTLRVAMRDLVRRGAVEVPREDMQRSRVRLFRHVGIWLVVSFGLFLMNLFDRSSEWWFQWTMVSWGIAVGIHAVVALLQSPRRALRMMRYRSQDPSVEADAHIVSMALGQRSARARVGAQAARVRVAPVTVDDGERARLAQIEAEVEAELAGPDRRARVERSG